MWQGIWARLARKGEACCTTYGLPLPPPQLFNSIDHLLAGKTYEVLYDVLFKNDCCFSC